MEVISGMNISKYFKKIPEYKIDLGLAIKIDDSGRKGDYASGGLWKVKDKTIKKYYENFGKYLNRTGKIGTLLFYVDNTIKDECIYIIHDNKIYSSIYDKNANIRSFISKLITDILENKLKPEEKIIEKQEVFVDIKNMTNDELAKYLLRKSKEE
jgi:hypothetical protein